VGPEAPPGSVPDTALEHSVVRATAQISAITFIARLAGFARWVLLGYAVGTTFLGNVYQTANTIPNIVFELVAGGLLASVLVPTFVRELDRGPERVAEIASTLANALLLVSVPLVVVGIALARPLMSGLLVGVSDPVLKAQQVELGAWFLRFFLPQVPLYLLGIVMQGVLHAHRRFVWPAMGPLLSSATVIGTYLVFRSVAPDATLETVTRPQLALLAGGTTLGVFVLTFCQLPSVLRLGLRWKPVLSWRDPVVRRALRAGGWGAGYLGITQLILLVVVILANRVEGGVVAYQIANAFFELPNALIGLPLALSLYPALSDAFHKRDETRYGELLSSGVRLTLFGAIPAGVGLFLLAPTASNVLLGWAHDVRPALVAATLQGLAIGVPAWLLLSILVRALYARGMTAKPFVMNGMAFAVLLCVGVGGTVVARSNGVSAMRLIGGAVSAGWWVAAIAGVVLLVRLARGWDAIDVVRTLAVNAARAALMGVAVWAVLRALRGSAPGLVVLLAAVATGAAVIALTAWRSEELRATLAVLGRGQAGGTPAPSRGQA
jgi:putative peptidoglycan lipid II flippase